MIVSMANGLRYAVYVSLSRQTCTGKVRCRLMAVKKVSSDIIRVRVRVRVHLHHGMHTKVGPVCRYPQQNGGMVLCINLLMAPASVP